MSVFRVMLLGLAVIVLVAFGWRLVGSPTRVRPGATTVPAQAQKETAPASSPAPGTPVLSQSTPVPAPAAGPAAQSADPATRQAGESQTIEAQASTPPSPQSGADQPRSGLTAQEARAKLDAVLPAAPDLARAFDVLKAQFPTVAERSFAEATEAYRQSNVIPSPDDLFADAMHDLRESAGVLAGKAGAAALGAIFDMKASLLADLEQADPRICADYLFGGTSPEFSDFLASHRALVAQAALVDINAMADGRTNQKAWGAPSIDDFRWIETELRKKGLAPDEIAALLDGRAADPSPPDARLCDNGRTYLAVLKTMPAEARNRIYGLTAELLARS